VVVADREVEQQRQLVGVERVSGLVRDAAAAPERRVGNDAVAVREVIGAAVGCEPFSLRVLRAMRGRSFERTTGDAEEVLFVLRGSGDLIVDDDHYALAPETGVALAPGSRYELQNDSEEDMVIVAVALHDPEPAAAGGAREPSVSRLAEAEQGTATADRTFRIVFDPARGCASATQFVGYIPVGAAPRHYHLYEEVIYVLDGDGVMHMNGEETPLHKGSCIHLPPRKLHTLENSGPDVMRVLGVFRPAGSPAAAFYPDGTPAYQAGEPQTTSTHR
jgi:mannose-6-phosphate isomerase-like protein (cupin superfamily)